MGAVLVVVGAGAWVISSFWLRTRLPKALVTVLVVGSGIAVGSGALLLQDGVSASEWAVTLISMGTIAAFQARLMLGPFGKPSPASGTVSPRR